MLASPVTYRVSTRAPFPAPPPVPSHYNKTYEHEVRYTTSSVLYVLTTVMLAAIKLTIAHSTLPSVCPEHVESLQRLLLNDGFHELHHGHLFLAIVRTSVPSN